VLESARAAPFPVETILVVNTRDRLARDRLAVHAGPTLRLCTVDRPIGSAAARCLGIGIARGEFIAFTDEDCLVPRNWISALHAVCTTRGVCGSRIVAANYRRDLIVRVEEETIFTRPSPLPGVRLFVSHCSLMARRTLLRPPLPHWENRADDVQVSLQYLCDGIAVADVPEVSVAAFLPETLAAAIRRRLRHGRGFGFLQIAGAPETWTRLSMPGPWQYAKSILLAPRPAALRFSAGAVYVALQLWFAACWGLSAQLYRYRGLLFRLKTKIFRS